MSKVLKLRISILDVKPEIFREILVKDNITFEALHKIIQLSFGWTNSHLYSFTVKETQFSVPNKDFPNEDLNVKNTITEILFRKGQKALYIYDFGDNWEHEIKVIEVMHEDKEIKYPICIGGKRNAPPEDCGGFPGYEEVIKAFKNPQKKESKDLLEWLGDYNPEEFDIDEVNELIRNPDKYIIDFKEF